jgi:hypothetical protein
MDTGYLKNPPISQSDNFREEIHELQVSIECRAKRIRFATLFATADVKKVKTNSTPVPGEPDIHLQCEYILKKNMVI